MSCKSEAIPPAPYTFGTRHIGMVLLLLLLASCTPAVGQTITLQTANQPANGITQGELYLGQNNIVLFGFQVKSDQNVLLRTINIGSTNNLGDYLGNFRLYRSAFKAYSPASATLVPGADARVLSDHVELAQLTETVGNIPVYYFLVGDYIKGTDPTNSFIKFSFSAGQSAPAIITNLESFNSFSVTDGRRFSFFKINRWTGSSSSNWSTPGNWSLGTVPAQADNAYIGFDNSYTRQPVITGNANLTNLIIGGNINGTINAGVSLTINNGKLTVSNQLHQESLYNDDLANSITGRGQLQVGQLVITGAKGAPITTDRTTQLTIGTAAFTASDILLSANQSGNFTNNAACTIGSASISLSGVIQTTNAEGATSMLTTNPGTLLTITGGKPGMLSGRGTNRLIFSGVVNYSGTSAQTVITGNEVGYSTLKINNASPTGASLLSEVAIPNLIIGDVVPNSTLDRKTFGTITGSLAMSNRAKMIYAGSSLTFPPAATLADGTTIELNGLTDQTIEAGNKHFKNLLIDESPAKRTFQAANPGSELTIDGSLTLNAGNVDYMNVQDITIKSDFNGEASLSPSESIKTITIGGNWNNSAGGVLNPLVTYNGGNQKVSGKVSYTNLTFTGAGTKTIGEDLSISEDLTINMPASIAYSGKITITLGRDFLGDGPVSSSAGSPETILIKGDWRNAAAGTIGGSVIYEGASQRVSTGVSYTNLTLQGSGSKEIGADTLDVAGSFFVDSLSTPLYFGTSLIRIGGDYLGTGSFNSGPVPVTISGNWINKAPQPHLSGKITFDGDDISRSQSVPLFIDYHDLELSGHSAKQFIGAAGRSAVSADNLTINSAHGVMPANITEFRIRGDLDGSVPPQFGGQVSLIVRGNWQNSGKGTVPGPVILDGSDQLFPADITFTQLSLTGSGSKTATTAASPTVFHVARDLSITSPATLNFDPNVSSIQINGNLLGNSLIQSGTIPVSIAGNWDNSAKGRIAGRVNYTGTSAQRVGALDYTDLYHSGGGTKTLTGAATLEGILELAGQSTILESDGKLTLLSNQASTSGIAPLPSGTSITGAVNVQTYISGGSVALRGTRIISPPVLPNTALSEGGIYAQIRDSILVTGPGGTANGFDAGGNAQPFAVTLTRYNETARMNESQFTPVSNISEKIAPGEAFFLYYRGNRSNAKGKLNAPYAAPEPVRTLFQGQLNQGPIKVNLSYHGYPNEEQYNGYNVVGNPYPSVIDWTKVIRENAEDFMMFIKPGGGYAYYSNGITSNADGQDLRYIRPGQGFYVRASARGSSLTFTEAAKVIRTNIPSKLMHAKASGASLPAAIESALTIAGKLQLIRLKLTNRSNTEEATIVFADRSSQDATPEDATFFGGTSLSLCTLSADNKQLAINYLPDPLETKQVRLVVGASASGKVQLTISQNDLIGVQTFLDDAFTRQLIDTKKSPAYELLIDKNNPDTYGDQRLKLVFVPSPRSSVEIARFQAEPVGGSVQLTWITGLEENSDHFDIQRSADGSNFKTIAQVAALGSSQTAHSYRFTDQKPLEGVSYYQLKAWVSDTTAIYSPVVKVTYKGTRQVADLLVFPNPATSLVHVSMADKNRGLAQINIYDLQGRLVKYQKIAGSVTGEADVSGLQPGTYIIEAIDFNSRLPAGRKKLLKTD